MKHLNQFCVLFCILTVILALGACTPASSSAAVEPTETNQPAETSQPPQTDLEAVLQVPITLPDGDSVELAFTMINQSETGLYVLKWYTPLEGLGGEIFRVERDGQPIPYEGPLAMRGDPTPEGYVLLDAGASVSATVDLAAAYDFSKPGTYTIAFISPRISHVARTEAEMAKTVEDLGPIQICSNRVTVSITSTSGTSSRDALWSTLTSLGDSKVALLSLNLYNNTTRFVILFAMAGLMLFIVTVIVTAVLELGERVTHS
jgi:hypothetical protein